MEKATTTEAEVIQFRQAIRLKRRGRVLEAIQTVLEKELTEALGCEFHER